LHVVEGEKDVVTMGQCRIPAVCFPDGCVSVPTGVALEAIMESGFTEACVVYDADDGGDRRRQVEGRRRTEGARTFPKATDILTGLQ